MKKAETAISFFRNKFNCAQSVLVPFGPESGINENDSLKLASAFGGGMGRQQKTCGAITGALMVLGLKYGKGLNDPEDMKLLTYDKTRELFERFRELNGSTDCIELLDGLSLIDPAEHKEIADRNLFQLKCEKYLADAVSILEDIIDDKK